MLPKLCEGNMNKLQDSIANVNSRIWPKKLPEERLFIYPLKIWISFWC